MLSRPGAIGRTKVTFWVPYVPNADALAVCHSAIRKDQDLCSSQNVTKAVQVENKA